MLGKGNRYYTTWETVLKESVLRDYYLNQNISIPKIAKLLGCHKSTVTRAFVKFNIRRKSKKELYRSNIGTQAFHWLGGKYVDSYGYVNVYAPTHPNKIAGRYIKEHRLVMEQHLGRKLKRIEVVHHKNGIKADNRIENLELFASLKEHSSFHGKQKLQGA